MRLQAPQGQGSWQFLAIFLLCSPPPAQYWCRVLSKCWRKECRPCVPHWDETPFCSSENQDVKVWPFEQRREESRVASPPCQVEKERSCSQSQRAAQNRILIFPTKDPMLILFDLGFYWIYLSNWSDKSNWESTTSTKEALLSNKEGTC